MDQAAWSFDGVFALKYERFCIAFPQAQDSNKAALTEGLLHQKKKKKKSLSLYCAWGIYPRIYYCEQF